MLIAGDMMGFGRVDPAVRYCKVYTVKVIAELSQVMPRPPTSEILRTGTPLVHPKHPDIWGGTPPELLSQLSPFSSYGNVV